MYKYLFILCYMFSVAAASVVQMRFVKETANYGYFANSVADVDNANKLIPSVIPANFSGPELLERLLGKCFNLTQDTYRYTFCPFQNFTQYEISPRWNAYQGILGIWSHWDIENNTFAAMVLKNGDHCGDVERSVRIVLICGANETLLNVTEPSKCQYSAEFSTRYACHEDALLVYPRMSPELQKEWDLIYTDFRREFITEKGYKKFLQELFEKAGYGEPVQTKLPETATSAILVDGSMFSDLQSCNQEYKNLQNEISKLNMELEALKVMLDLSKVHNPISKSQRMSA